MYPEIGLGPVQTTFGPNKANAKIILYVMPVFILVGLVLIGSIPFGGILMLVIAAGLFAGYLMQMRARVDIHQNGLAGIDWRGRRFAFRWDAVTGVYEFIGYNQHTGHGANQWVYTVHTRDGQRIKLDMSYEKTRSLGYTVLKETGKLLLPAAQEALRSGGTVSFGEQVSLDQGGFVAQGGTLPWDQVEKIEINRSGDLLLRRKGLMVPWKMVMHSAIANFPVFRSLLHAAVRGTPAELLLEDPAYEQAMKTG